MSKKERARLVVMAKVMKSEVKISEPYDGCEASELLGLSYRQTFQIAKQYGTEGAVGLVHWSRGRASNRAWDDGEKRKILERYSERYAGYGLRGLRGPTFTVEKLEGDKMYRTTFLLNNGQNCLQHGTIKIIPDCYPCLKTTCFEAMKIGLFIWHHFCK